jgi:hypothetical protein
MERDTKQVGDDEVAELNQNEALNQSVTSDRNHFNRETSSKLSKEKSKEQLN